MNLKVDEYLDKAIKWRDEMKQLRAIILDCGLAEEFKWGAPCYMFQKTNLLIIQSFKAYCALGFFKGALLADSHGILQTPGEQTQSGRLIRFVNVQEILEKEAILKAYIYEAIEAEKAGEKVILKKNTELVFSDELQKELDKNSAFKKAFETLTPGRQRAYNLYFSAPKQSKTRETRIEKYMQQILNGKGINDCICGLSKKMPYCDGSHKNL